MYNDITPQILMIIGIVVGVLFVGMVLRLYCDVRFLRKSRKDLDNRIGRLRLNDMIGRLHINRNKYMNRTSDLDKERHIWACERCPEPDDCERMFEGEDLDPHEFLSLIHISEPTRPPLLSRMPSSA